MGPQCFGGIFFDNSARSALIVFLLGRYDVSSSPSSPPRNLFLESLLCMHSFSLKGKKKKRRNTCQSDFKKVFCFFLSAEQRTSLWLKRVEKAWEKQPCDGWQGTGNYWQHNIHWAHRGYHTLSTIYMHIRSRLWQCEIILSFFYCGKGYISIQAEIHLRLPAWHTDKYTVQKVHRHSPTHTHCLQQTGSHRQAQMRHSQVHCTRSTKAGFLIIPGSITRT